VQVLKAQCLIIKINCSAELGASLQFVKNISIAVTYDTVDVDILKFVLHCYAILCMLLQTVYVFIVN